MTSSNLAKQSSGKVSNRFNLVSKLLEEPDQVANILPDHENIIDYALVQFLENISEYMTKQNRIKTANFLKDVTDQIQRHINDHNFN